MFRKLMAFLLLAFVTGTQAQTIRYIHTDALGSVAVVTDANRNVVDRREYEPYGQQLSGAVSDGPGYTGHVQDVATGLSYMQQRYYDSLIGIFLSSDPVGIDLSSGKNFNRYKYASNNPYRFTDPDGRYDCQASRGECQQIDRAMTKVYKAQEKATGSARTLLDGIAGFLGKKDDGNGVAIINTDNNSGSWTNLNRGGILRVNFEALNNSVSSLGGSAQDFMVASTLTHEGWHGWWEKLAYAAGISNPWSTSYIMNNERRAGISEGVLAKSLNYSHPQGFWTSNAGFDMKAINEQAAASTASKCAASARGGLSCGE